MKITISRIAPLLIFIPILILRCTPPNLCDPMQNTGIGPIEKLDLVPVNTNVAAEGQVLYDQLCRVCHNEINQMEGPAHWGIINRRTPEWIMNMMLNPTEMAQEDPIAKILAERVNGVEMPDMNLSEEEALKILEYFRTLQ
ncbi:MAG: c-type cytochrome [Reichenbachiella sp.]|uniref:c-type cytochrome n=1 Tax=Reichenbachiella sp. TaxID=2184521 RepID=UPI003267349F